jgi:hypothetical protein
MKTFLDKQKLKQYMTTKPALQKILKGIPHKDDECTQYRERMVIIKSQENSKQLITEN